MTSLFPALRAAAKSAVNNVSIMQRMLPGLSLVPRRECKSWVAAIKDDRFLRRKYGALFQVYDTNKDGLFCSEDVKIYQQRIVDAAKLEGERKERFMVYSQDFFEGWVDKKDTKLNKDEFIDQLLWYRKTMPDKLRDVLVNKSLELHHALDTNGDGYIEVSEFLSWSRSMLIDDDHLGKLLFNLIDEDSDHKLQVDEMIHFFMNFMMHENVDPATQLFFDVAGPTHNV